MTLRYLAIAGLVALTFTPPLPAQEIVEVTGRDRPIDADLEEVFRVGVLEGESWEMLGTVRKAAFDARGNLYLFDGSGGVTGPWLDPRVLVFDADGSFVHTFGRSGQGPGEFNMPLNLAVMRDGTAVVGDLGHRAYQLFDESGAFARMVRMEMSGLAVAQSDMHTDPGGNGVYAVPALGGAMGRPGTDPPASRPIIRLGLEGDIVRLDTVAEGWLPPPPETPDTRIPGVEVEGRPVTLRDLGMGQSSVFEPQVLIGVLPGGRVVYSDSSAYAIKVMDAGSAQVERVIVRPFDPVPVTPAIEEAEKERMQARQAAMGGGRTKMLEIRGPDGSSQSTTFQRPEPAFFPELPVIHAVSGTWEGRIWVQRRGEDPNSGGAIDVLTAEGDYLGTFPAGTTALPDAFGPDGLAAFIELDEFDVATVVVRRLPAAVR